MKLILCIDCQDVVRLQHDTRYCKCGKASGRYVDDVNAEVNEHAIPLGFANDDFVRAVQMRPLRGVGSRFQAFVIPQECESVEVIKS